MLQVDVLPFASDALEDAMRLAQIKALNSFTFSDCMSYLNNVWSDIYDRVACIDSGYYGTNIEIKKKLTKLPKYVKNTLQVYAAQNPVDYNRYIYREAGNTDITSSNTYKISGNDLYCADAERRKIWLYFVPACPQLFFTMYNRDPKIHETHDVSYNLNYNTYRIEGRWYTDEEEEYEENGETKTRKVRVTHTVDASNIERSALANCTEWLKISRWDSAVYEDITDYIIKDSGDDLLGEWNLVYISCDYPYIFVTYENSITHEHVSGIIDHDMEFTQYNPFDFTGRNSDIEYLECKWNDKTGMGVYIIDYNDIYTDTDGNEQYRIKELGWTPDTQLRYPSPVMYRYLVARLAEKIASVNESTTMGIQLELADAKYAFEAYLDKNKSAWTRIENVNPATIGDWL